MRFILSKLYAITDACLTGLSHAAQVERLIAGGVRFVQLRDKAMSPREFYAQAREALQIARAADVKIIINDRLDIALAVGADGVHLGQDDLDVSAARELANEIAGEDFIIGYSTHTVEQATAACRLPVSYIAIGPVFDTSTKANPDATVGIEGVRRVREAIDKLKCDVPLVAIGGITLETAREVIDAGADSVAVIGDLLREASVIEVRARAFVDWLRDIGQELKHPQR